MESFFSAMAAVHVYLHFDGQCLEAFTFYKSIFGGEFPYVGTYGQMPPQEGLPSVAEADKDKIMHMSLSIGKETLLMGSDVVENFGTPPVIGDNFSIFITANSKEEADQIFNALSEGGHPTMPMTTTFWGDYYGMLTDKFKINWMVRFSPQTHNNGS